MSARRLWWVLVLALAAAPSGAAAAETFSEKPLYIDPALGGWAAPLQTVAFQVGCGELHYVLAIYLGQRELHVVSRSKVTLRRPMPSRLQQFADKLRRALEPAVSDLARRGLVEGVVLTFYSSFLERSTPALEIAESCLPARNGLSPSAPIPLWVSEIRR